MKKLFICLCLAAVCWSCGKKQSSESQITDVTADENIEVDVEFNPHSFLMTDSILPEKIDLGMDISDMTLMELRLLRSYPYALQGLWFEEADINGFFNAKAPWYYDRCYAVMEKNADSEPLTEYAKAKLSEQERAFIERCDARIAELTKLQEVDRDGLKLSNPSMTVNLFQLEEYDQAMLDMLAHHNFAIAPTDKEQLFNIYEENDYSKMPNYITTDLFLQAYHMYFGYVLKTLEKHIFTERIHALCQAMHKEAVKVADAATDDEIRNLAEFNAAYFAIADHLLKGTSLPIPAQYQKDAAIEIDNIKAQREGISPMMKQQQMFSYDLFKPRGHYTRSKAQEQYFRSMMWLQTFTFCSESINPVKQAAMMGYLLNHIDRKVCKEGVGVYHTLDFLMGEPDNVSVIEMAECLSQNKVGLNELTSDRTLNLLSTQLNTLFRTRNRINNKLGDDGCNNKVNFMPQRYMPDSYVLSRTFDENANSGVPFPRGLHVFSAFGIETADAVNEAYYHDADNWTKYTAEMDTLKQEFTRFTDWDKSMYNKWFESLVQLQKPVKDYPGYMLTGSWAKKNLNSALASWAELRHDAILYAEQPIVAECGGGEDLPTPVSVGYVEPNLAFWNKMKEMLTLTRTLLTDNGLMTDDLDSKTTSLEDYMDFCIAVSKKELANQPLTDEEFGTIEFMGSSLEWFTLGVLDPDMSPDSWGLVEGADRSIAVCADVFTRNVLGCKKCGILTEATGLADAIYVIVPINGNIFITRGAVFSYYEFVNPLNTRYTDEEWQQRLSGDDVPARPIWMQPLLLNKVPMANQEIFYSSGC